MLEESSGVEYQVNAGQCWYTVRENALEIELHTNANPVAS